MPPSPSRYLNQYQQVTQWPSKQVDQAAVLDHLATKIPPGQNFTEANINEILKQWHTFGDWSMLRRALVDAGHLHRTSDGAKYWRPFPHVDTKKAAAVLILRRRLLVVRAQGLQRFEAPSGQIEADETPQQTLVRQLRANLSINVAETDLIPINDYIMPAEDLPNQTNHTSLLYVRQWQGEMHHAGQIEELQWLTAQMAKSIPVEKLVSEQIVPLLAEQGQID